MEKLNENFSNAHTEHFCNLCSMSCRGFYGNFNGLINARVTGGPDSSHFEDGATYKFSICEPCLLNIFSKCKLNPYQGNYISPKNIHEFHQLDEDLQNPLLLDNLQKAEIEIQFYEARLEDLIRQINMVNQNLSDNLIE